MTGLLGHVIINPETAQHIVHDVWGEKTNV